MNKSINLNSQTKPQADNVACICRSICVLTCMHTLPKMQAQIWLLIFHVQRECCKLQQNEFGGWGEN